MLSHPLYYQTLYRAVSVAKLQIGKRGILLECKIPKLYVQKSNDRKLTKLEKRFSWQTFLGNLLWTKKISYVKANEKYICISSYVIRQPNPIPIPNKQPNPKRKQKPKHKQKLTLTKNMHMYCCSNGLEEVTMRRLDAFGISFKRY